VTQVLILCANISCTVIDSPLLYISDRDVNMDHATRIRSHYSYLVGNIDMQYLVTYLSTNDVISAVQMKDINSPETCLCPVQKLLSLIAIKSAEDFHRFLEALEQTGQGHVAAVLINNNYVMGRYIIYRNYNVLDKASIFKQ